MEGAICGGWGRTMRLVPGTAATVAHQLDFWDGLMMSTAELRPALPPGPGKSFLKILELESLKTPWRSLLPARAGEHLFGGFGV